jgi:hypothetical protein
VLRTTLLATLPRIPANRSSAGTDYHEIDIVVFGIFLYFLGHIAFKDHCLDSV